MTQIADGARTFPMPQGFVRNVPREQALAAAEAAYMPAGMVTVPFNPVVINTGSKLVLIDAGYGHETLPTAGLLPANMAAAGIDARAIDIVVLSHLHPDHYQRHQGCQRRAGVSQCRDQGAGGRLGVLDVRRQHGQGPGQRR